MKEIKKLGFFALIIMMLSTAIIPAVSSPISEEEKYDESIGNTNDIRPFYILAKLYVYGEGSMLKFGVGGYITWRTLQSSLEPEIKVTGLFGDSIFLKEASAGHCIGFIGNSKTQGNVIEIDGFVLLVYFYLTE